MLCYSAHMHITLPQAVSVWIKDNKGPKHKKLARCDQRHPVSPSKTQIFINFD